MGRWSRHHRARPSLLGAELGHLLPHRHLEAGEFGLVEQESKLSGLNICKERLFLLSSQEQSRQHRSHLGSVWESLALRQGADLGSGTGTITNGNCKVGRRGKVICG